MYPELHLLGSITLNTYRTFGILATAFAVTVTGISLLRKGIPLRQCIILMWAMSFGFLAGARTLNLLMNPTLYTGLLEALTDFHWGNFSLMGGLIGSAFSGILAAFSLKLSPWSLGDGAIMGTSPAIFLAKLGCFGNGCCFGTPTELPWGVVYPVGSTPAAYYMAKALPSGDFFGLFSHLSQSLHPTQLYEAFGALVCLGIAVILSKWLPAQGSRFLIFLIGFSAVRLFSWHLRVAPPDWAMGPAFYPLLYGLIMAGSLLALLFRNRAPSV